MRSSFTFLLVTLLVACSSEERFEQPLPAELQLVEPQLFSVDRSTETFRFGVEGSDAQLLGALADRDGRRSLAWQEGGRTTELAPKGWLLPPAAAVGTGGAAIVCWNELTGKSSDLTEGSLPDPRDGLGLLCRARDDRGRWGASRSVVPGSPVAWLVAVRVAPPGFVLDYRVDGGLFVHSSAPSHGTYRLVLGLDGSPTGAVEFLPGKVSSP